MPSPRVSPVTRPNNVSTPTLPVGMEVTLHSKRSKTIAAMAMRRTPPPRKLGMPGKGPEYPVRESAMFSPVRTTAGLPLPITGSDQRDSHRRRRVRCCDYVGARDAEMEVRRAESGRMCQSLFGTARLIEQSHVPFWEE